MTKIEDRWSGVGDIKPIPHFNDQNAAFTENTMSFFIHNIGTYEPILAFLSAATSGVAFPISHCSLGVLTSLWAIIPASAAGPIRKAPAMAEVAEDKDSLQDMTACKIRVGEVVLTGVNAEALMTMERIPMRKIFIFHL